VVREHVCLPAFVTLQIIDEAVHENSIRMWAKWESRRTIDEPFSAAHLACFHCVFAWRHHWLLHLQRRSPRSRTRSQTNPNTERTHLVVATLATLATTQMRLNQHTCLLGHKVVLLPYMASHVAQYHAWMSDPELLRLTASEPLSLEDEYANQVSWLADARKLTFIVAAADAERRLLGDVNVYLHAHLDAGQAEIAVMIAEPSARRSGCAREALLLMMAYAAAHLGVAEFLAKIDRDNTASRWLFQKLGFTADGVDPDDPALAGEPNVFGEVELRLRAASLPDTELRSEFVARPDVTDDGDHGAQNVCHASSRHGSLDTAETAKSASLHGVDSAANLNSA
jgi:RimJ/RimL family protein N-acetyltransferase